MTTSHHLVGASLIGAVLALPSAAWSQRVVAVEVPIAPTGGVGISGLGAVTVSAPQAGSPAALSLTPTLTPLVAVPTLQLPSSVVPSRAAAPAAAYSPAQAGSVSRSVSSGEQRAPTIPAAPRAEQRSSNSPLNAHRLASDVADAVEQDGADDIAAKAKLLHRVFDNAGEAQRFMEELQAPGRVLASQGIETTITVYGSARLLDQVTAKRRLDEAIARRAAAPKSREARGQVWLARQALRMSKYYEEARRFAHLVARATGGKVAIVTGGGGGAMEAANRGALEGGGPSVGYNIELRFEQALNGYVTPGLGYQFKDFATRKKGLRKGSAALVFIPGGFGTLDELFEVLTLMQTGKMPKLPVVLLGYKSFWKKVINVAMLAKTGLISPEDPDLILRAETAEDAWAAVQDYYDKKEAAPGSPAPLKD